MQSMEAPDVSGNMYDRCHDAEFKLLADLSLVVCAALSHMVCPSTAVLFSNKPLCSSCVAAVKQLQQRLPYMQLEVVIGEPTKS